MSPTVVGLSAERLSFRPVEALRVEGIVAPKAIVRTEPSELQLARIGPIGATRILEDLAFWPGLAGVLAQPTLAPEASGGAPLLDSQVGNVFRDQGDPALLWHLPAYELAPDPDASFAFGARQDALSDENGHPFNVAALTLSLRKSVPADALAQRDAQPASRLQEIPIDHTGVTLNLAFKSSSDGSQQMRSIAGTAGSTAEGLLLTFDGLLGDDVIRAFTALATTAAASVTLMLTYVVDDIVRKGRWWDDALLVTDRQPVLTLVSAQRFEALSLRRAGGALHDPQQLRPPGALTGPNLKVLVPFDTEGIEAVELRPRPVTTTIRHPTTTAISLPIAGKFAGSGYRQRYTVTTSSGTRAIVNTDDLDLFDVVQSQYQELTALGDVASRYPSLRALYVGLVSGTVVAVPAAYGIQRTAKGCEAACDALVDSGSALSTGCRFRLTFTLAPAVDPGDLVRLVADLATVPALAQRDWNVVLPSDLDRRTPPTFTSPLVDATTFAVGPEPHTFLVGVDIEDDDLPAVVKVNAFLKQLSASGPPPLVGRLAVRLDDAYPSAVTASAILDLHTTSGDQELVVAPAQPGSVSVQNVAPYDVRLEHHTSRAGDRFSTVPLNQVLPGGATTTLAAAADTQIFAVHRSLELPEPMPPRLLASYVTFRTTDVQRIHHLLGINATGVLDDAPAAGRITALAVTIALEDAPDVDIPAISLDAARAVDKVTVDIPVQSAFTGLRATLTISGTREGVPEPLRVSLDHDFFSAPILVLTTVLLGLA